jgi:hypothetical protein
VYKKIVLLLPLVIMVSWAGTALGETSETTLVLKIGDINAQKNGYTQILPVAPRLINGRTMVPLVLANSIGFTTSWDGVNNTAIVSLNDFVIKLPIDKYYAIVNGTQVPVDVPAQVIEDRTFVPLKFIAENLGCTVTWEGSTQTATIKSSGVSPAIGKANIFVNKVLRTTTLPSDLDFKNIPQTAKTGNVYYIVYLTCYKIYQPHLVNIGECGDDNSFITNVNGTKYYYKGSRFYGIQFLDPKNLFKSEFADGANGFIIFEIPENFVPAKFTLVNTYQNTLGSTNIKDSVDFQL